MMDSAKFTQTCCALVMCLLTGCSQHQPAPVIDLYSPAHSIARADYYANTGIPATYKVRPGDTLFSIAWFHSLDHKELAEINNLKNNLIYPGQVIKLLPVVRPEDDDYFDANSLIAALNKEILKQPVALTTSTSKSKPLKYTQRRTAKQSSQPSKRQTRKVPVKVAKVERTKPKKTYQPRKKRPALNNRKSSKLNWIWPTDGRIVEGFSSQSNSNRGLDIAGSRGQAVRASAPGRVVYEGNGLRGYGKLVIIKHNNDFLSAYAHNDTIHVAENEFVKAGQRIADVGSSGTQSDKLHFEIRYKGKPVDPLNYLPKR